MEIETPRATDFTGEVDATSHAARELSRLEALWKSSLLGDHCLRGSFEFICIGSGWSQPFFYGSPVWAGVQCKHCRLQSSSGSGSQGLFTQSFTSSGTNLEMFYVKHRLCRADCTSSKVDFPKCQLIPLAGVWMDDLIGSEQV